jgi:sodium transport system permease protein
MRRSGEAGVLRTLFEYEIRMLLRDRRTIGIAVVAPLLLFPAMIFIMRWVERREAQRLEEATYTYAVDGTLADEARGWVREAIELAEAQRDTAETVYHFEEQTPANADSLLEEGELQVVVRSFTPEEFRALRATERASEDSIAGGRAGGPAAGGSGNPEEGGRGDPAGSAASEEPGPEVPTLRLLFRANSDLSRTASTIMGQALTDLRTERRDFLYRESGLPVDPDLVAAVSAENVASAEREGGAMIGLLLTPLLLFLMLSGGSIVAADAIAGEKERGTLETLLTTAASRARIVQAKMLSIVAVGLAVASINILNMLVYMGFGLLELPEEFAVSVTPVMLLVVLVLFLPLTLLVASVLLLVSGWSKSYKEYQIYFFPIFCLFVIPSLAGMLPGMELRSVIAVVPIANIGVAVREVMVGDFDWPFLLLALGSTSAMAAWAASLTGRTLSTERLISQSDLEEADLVGGPALFARHVLAWFGVMWVVLLAVSLWYGDRLGIRGQVAVNLLGIFLGGTVLMIKRYRLPIRLALALKPVKPVVWLAVLIGAPSALLVGNGVAQLAQYFLPVSEQMIESFGQFMLPDDVPLWQIVLFLAVLPGICEELAFRGVLLYGLSKRLRPMQLALVVGVVFGLFHVSLFRLIPTGYLGVVLTAVTLLTGSIFPAMLWHTLNNATALVPAYLGWFSADLALESWMYWMAAAGLALSFWILWRARTPYRGIRTRRPEN